MLTQTAAVAATVFLGLSAVLIWTAAWMPTLFPVWFRRDELTVIARHLTLWRVNSAMFSVSAVAALIGLALAFPLAAGPFVLPSLLLFTAATALWSVDTALRLSVISRAAQDPTEQNVHWYELSQSWSNAMWYTASAMLILGFAGLGATVLTSGVLPAWVGWVCLASAALTTVEFVWTRDVAPIVAYLPILPLAIATGIAATTA